MNIISINTPIAKRRHVCEFCGDFIVSGSKYSYIKHRTRSNIYHVKSHSLCCDVARNLGLLERDTVSKYTFVKRVVDFIVDLHQRGGKKVKRKVVESYPMSHLTEIANKYFLQLNDSSKQSSSVGEGTMKEILSLYITLFMMPRVMDDVVYDLESEGKYKHKVKKALKSILTDFESMSNALCRLYQTNTSLLDDFMDHSMDIYEEIQEAIELEGLERSANILSALVNTIGKKYDKISKDVDVVDNVKHIIDIKCLMKSVLKFKKHSFVDFLVDDKCSSKGISIVDDKK